MKKPEDVPKVAVDPDGASHRAMMFDVLAVLLLVAVTVLLTVDFRNVTLRSLGARHASVTLDFWQRHQFFDIHDNYAPYLTKLPFPFWLLSVPVFFFGPGDASLRLISEVFGIALVLMSWFLGRRLFGSLGGLFAGLAAGVNVLLGWVVGHSLIDSSGIFLIDLSVVFFWLGWRDESRRTRYVFLFYLASALATWHRGPLGFLLPGLTVAAALIPLDQWRVLKQFLNPLAILLWLALVVPYGFGLSHAHLHQTVFAENLLHFVQGEATYGTPDSVRPPYYWSAMFLYRCLPWTGFFLLSLVYAVRRRSSPERAGLWFLAAWLGSWFLFWHLAAARNETYLLYLLVPASVFTGYVLQGLWRDADEVIDTLAKRLWLLLSFVVLAIANTLMPAAMLLDAHVEVYTAMWIVLTCALGLLGLATVLFAVAASYRHALVVGVCLSVLAGGIVGLFVEPVLDRTQPGKDLMLRAAKLIANRPVVIYGNSRHDRLVRENHSLVLYLNSPHPVDFVDDPKKARKLWKNTPGVVLLVPESAKEEIKQVRTKVVPVRLQDPSGGFLLYFSREKAVRKETTADADSVAKPDKE